MTDTPESVDDEISLLDLLQVVADNLRLLVLGPLAAGLIALGITFIIPPTYTATTRFMPPQQQQGGVSAMLAGLGAGAGSLLSAAGGIKNPADQFIGFLKSRSVQDALIDRFKLAERFEVQFKTDARKILDDRLSIANSKDGMISIDIKDKDPAFAALLANAHVDELSKLLSRLAITEAQQRRVFFEKQLLNAKDNLVKSEQALKSSGLNSSALKANPSAAVEGLAKLKATITAQEIKVASMRGYLNETAPEIKQALTELSAMRSQMEKSEKNDANTVATTPDGDSDYISKFRDFKYHETLFELFARQYEMARVDESKEGTLIQVVDIAVVPERKSGPKTAQTVILSVLIAGVFLLFFIFIRQAVRSTYSKSATSDKMSALRDSIMAALPFKKMPLS
jgi:uncharacterized protein involved in exopolysaccharide biosynthesis